MTGAPRVADPAGRLPAAHAEFATTPVSVPGGEGGQAPAPRARARNATALG